MRKIQSLVLIVFTFISTNLLSQQTICLNDTISADVMLTEPIIGFSNCGGFKWTVSLEFVVIKSLNICLEKGDLIQVIITCPNETFGQNLLKKGNTYSFKLVNALKVPNSQLMVFSFVGVY